MIIIMNVIMIIIILTDIIIVKEIQWTAVQVD